MLLDRDRRAAYDLELMGAELDAHQDESALAEDPTEPEATPDEPAAAPRVVPGWLLVAVAAVAALVVGACAVVAVDGALRRQHRRRHPPGPEQRGARDRADPVLRRGQPGNLEDDQRTAEGFMTDDYRAEYAKLFEVIKANAPETGTQVSTEVIASGVVRSGDDRVSVLVFVNRPTTNKQLKEPVVYKDQVTVTMQRVGDDWLVDDLVTSPAAG